MNSASKPVVLLGAGGHAGVLAALACALRYQILGVCDPLLAKSGIATWKGFKVLGDDSSLCQFSPDQIALVLGVGQVTTGNLRQKLYSTWKERGYSFPVLVHPAAWVAPDVQLGEGAQVMAGSIIQPGCEIGENSIVNTRASVDHDCSIAGDVHLAPGVILCGTVKVERGAFIGAGATVIQGVRIGEGGIVGAGVTLVRDLQPYTTIIGAASRIR